MTENIKKLLELASGNEELTAKLTSVSKEELIALAKENGITLTDADFAQNNEVSDDELNAVAGGRGCWCPAVGGGRATKENGQKACGCVLGGGGTATDGSTRCWCVGAGEGH